MSSRSLEADALQETTSASEQLLEVLKDVQSFKHLILPGDSMAKVNIIQLKLKTAYSYRVQYSYRPQKVIIQCS